MSLSKQALVFFFYPCDKICNESRSNVWLSVCEVGFKKSGDIVSSSGQPSRRDNQLLKVIAAGEKPAVLCFDVDFR